MKVTICDRCGAMEDAANYDVWMSRNGTVQITKEICQECFELIKSIIKDEFKDD